MMMLEAPPILLPAFGAGVLFCLLLGSVLSIPTIWHRLFRTDKDDPTISSGVYAKSTESGEGDLSYRWSVFKEPLNAWTSMAYITCGVTIFLVGFWDYLAKIGDEEDLPNAMANYAEFTMMLGSFSFYLGIASFLFHASHLEMWRKADAGMASGVVLPVLLFSIWDRLRPPLMHPYAFVTICNILLMSLTHGYVPNFSLDLLQPILTLGSWAIELAPRFGGVVDEEEYTFFLQCFLSLSGGLILRTVDAKRNFGGTVAALLTGYFMLMLLFSSWLGFMSPIIIVGFLSGFYVTTHPEHGHVFWHLFSAYALFIWWYMLRLRPGDPMIVHGPDTSIFCLLLFVATKNSCRRLIMAVPPKIIPVEYRDRIRLIIEHISFTIWGYYCLVVEPSPMNSWLNHPVLCWFLPVMPYDSFQLYFTAKCATHIEDAIYLWFNGTTFSAEPKRGSNVGKFVRRTAVPSLSTRAERANSELMRALHHNVTFLLCIVAFFTGYAKIASIVMFLHDISDIPLDCFIIFSLKGWRKCQLLSLMAAIPAWIYWRLIQFPRIALYTIAFQSKSMINRVACEPGHCSWRQVPERAPFLLCLFVILMLNAIWLWRMFIKGYRILYPKSFPVGAGSSGGSSSN